MYKGYGVVVNPMYRKILFKCNEFTTIVRVKTFDFGLKFVFNKMFKLRKDVVYTRFICHGIKPYVFGKMINQNKIKS